MADKSDEWKARTENESTRTPELVLPYATVGDKKLVTDVYLPSPKEGLDDQRPGPAIVFFHGGGLLMGTLKTYLPNWLIYEAHSRGWIFLSVEYRLLIPATAHAMVQDIDPSRLIVGGNSAGGYLAKLAVLYAETRPRAQLSTYGMGGQLLSEAFTSRGDDPYRVGLPPLDPSVYEDFTDLGKAKGKWKEEVSSVLMVLEPDMETDNGRRSQVTRVLLQTGKYLDVLTGIEGFSSRLVENGFDDPNIPEEAKPLSPELFHGSFPPTYLIHGAKDTVTFLQESSNTFEALKRLGIDTELVIDEEGGHGFEFKDAGTLEKYQGGAVKWLEKYV